METIYSFTIIKEKWDTQYLKDENVSESLLKANLYNACIIDCIGVYNCYANSLCKEEDDALREIATMISVLLRENY